PVDRRPSRSSRSSRARTCCAKGFYPSSSHPHCWSPRGGISPRFAGSPPPAPETIVGLGHGPPRGPVVSIGHGGTDAEALGASGIAVAPLARDGAEDLLRSVSGPPAGTQG